ncbi:MAG: UvrD-helicase domain-containing protein [Bacteroidales bacterium]|nr:UvrD-helicase domain-containing protein [Bacteroidales bacterium]
MNPEETILSQLNDQQQLAVKQVDGPVMVIAGAGSGKTRVLTYRIAYMLARGVNPYRVLALTFTNKAAAEMRARIVNLVGGDVAKAVTMGTFHSVFYRILRAEGDKLGYTHNLTVYDTDDSKSLIKNIVKDMNLDPKIYSPNFVLNRISMAKSNLLSPQEYANNPEIMSADRMAGKPLISEIFAKYNLRLKNADAMDFDDLLYYMNVLLRDFPEMLYKYQNRFNYILVDEYQDTNFAQYLIIKKLAAQNQNICVVGDDAQSIYGFRGADIQNILNFRRDYPNALIFKLEQNYRSTQNIVNAANAIIKHNKDQMPKDVWTDNEAGAKINLIKAGSDNDEAHAVASAIFEIKMNKHANNGQFAILYRTNIQSRTLEEAMVKRHIPYKIYGGLSFYKRKEIKDVLAYFRLTINHYDEESLRRVINYPMRGLGDTTISRVAATANERGVHFWDVVSAPQQYGLEVNAPTMNRLVEFADMIKGFAAQLQTTDAYELGKQIVLKTGIGKVLKENSDEKERLDHVEELLDSMKGFTEKEPESNFNEATGEIMEEYFPSLDHFMESIALLSDDEENSAEENEDKVKLMTIHSAKGLEFDYVFITGLEENLFPSSQCANSRQEMEEERRLFYVALTRARKMVTLTCAQTRYRFGSLQFCEDSRFLEEIPDKFLNITQKASEGSGAFARKDDDRWWKSGAWSAKGNLKPLGTSSPRSTQTSRPSVPKPQVKTRSEVQLDQVGTLASYDQIQPGVRVYHGKFGYGNVTSVEGAGPDAKAQVAFDTVGVKTLLLKFAKLVIPK